MRVDFLFLFLTSITTADALAQAPLAPEIRSFALSGSPSLSNASGTKEQQVYQGIVLASTVRSSSFCDANTQEVSLFGAVSDSVTKSGSTPAIAVITDEVGANYLQGLPGGKVFTDDAGQNHKLTQFFGSLSAKSYLNNSIGIALQQTYAGGFQAYLTSCRPTPIARHFFASAGLEAGFVDQRLYFTPTPVRSAVLPVSAQASYVFQRHDRKNQTIITTVTTTTTTIQLVDGAPSSSTTSATHSVKSVGSALPPKTPPPILSMQVGYTPYLNDPHDYQISESASLIFPTAWKFLTVSLLQSDLYVNNAPAPDKRNYHNEAIQLTFTFSKPPTAPSADLGPGSCYSADKAAHLFCYNVQTQNACPAPGIYRAAACTFSPGSPAYF